MSFSGYCGRADTKKGRLPAPGGPNPVDGPILVGSQDMQQPLQLLLVQVVLDFVVFVEELGSSGRVLSRRIPFDSEVQRPPQ